MTTRPAGPACRAVSRLWDSVAEDFLAGREVRQSLASWVDAYRGRGASAVQRDALPELFLGPLTKPRGVFLALNPGQADCSFHARGGIFAREIRETYGSYTAWAESWPYFREPWTGRKGPNRHHETRLRFLRDWLDDQELSQGAMASFELYPWHSARFSGRLDCEAAGKFFAANIRDVLAELNAPVFAFGARWFPILKHPRSGLQADERLNPGGPYGSTVESRRAMLLRGDGGLKVIAVKQKGYAGPPSRDETHLLRDLLADICP